MQAREWLIVVELSVDDSSSTFQSSFCSAFGSGGVKLCIDLMSCLFKGIMEFNNPNFHQLAGNGPNFKNSHWRSQLLTFCKTLDPC
ncbi:hypothetical protein Hanom_Chr02g00103221 [Helianthus anomalus]